MIIYEYGKKISHANSCYWIVLIASGPRIKLCWSKKTYIIKYFASLNNQLFDSRLKETKWMLTHGTKTVKLSFSSTHTMYNGVLLELKSFRSKKLIFLKYCWLLFTGFCKLYFPQTWTRHLIYSFILLYMPLLEI